MSGVIASVTALLLSVGILLVGHGLQLTLVPLYATGLEWSSEKVGYLGSAYFVGFVLGCISVPRLVASVGHIRVFAVLVASATCALLALGVAEVFWFWVFCRVVTGWAFAGLYMVIESWLNEKSTGNYRGSVLSVYTIITLLAICLGQVLIGIELTQSKVIMLAALLLVMSVIPVGLTKSTAPNPIPLVSFRPLKVIAASQVAMVGALFGGMVTGGFWALGPVVALANGLATEQIGYFMAATILGGACFQFPVGKLSDRIDRRYVIAGLAILGIVLCVIGAIFLNRAPELLYLVMFLFGGMTFPLYSLCLAHANDNTSLSLMEIASSVLMMNSLGSIIGPLLVAYLLPHTAYALFVVAASALVCLALWTLFRIQQHDVSREHFEPFVDMPRTTHEIVELAGDEQDKQMAA